MRNYPRAPAASFEGASSNHRLQPGCIATLLLALLSAAGSLQPGALYASDGGGSLALPLDKGAQTASAMVDYLLQQTASQTTRIRTVSVNDAVEGGAAKARKQAAEEAAQALQSGRMAYQNLEFDQALRAFEKAVALYEKADLAHEMPGLLRTLSLIGVTRFFSGEVRGARSVLTRLLSLRPDFAFDPEVYSPDVLELAESIRSSVQADQTYSLEILVTPGNARIYVDGVFRGLSPQELKKLAPAAHYVTVIAPGFALEQTTVRAGPGAISKISLTPAANAAVYRGHLEALKRGFASGDVTKAAAAMAHWIQADELLVAGVASLGNQRVRVVALRVAGDGHLLATAQRELNLSSRAALGEAGAFARALYASDLPRGPGGAPISAAIKVSTPMGVRSWSYISLGVGGAALTGAVVFALQASRSARDARAIPQLERARIAETVGSARTRAAVADTLFGLSAAAIGTGVYLLMPARGSSGSPNPIDEETERDPFALLPWIGPKGGGLVVVGQF